MNNKLSEIRRPYATIEVDWPLSSEVALVAANGTAMCKQKDERDTEFVKRIVKAYIAALCIMRAQDSRAAKAVDAAGARATENGK